MDAVIQSAVQSISELSGIMLYAAVVFVVVEAVKNFIPDAKRAAYLPVAAFLLGVVIVGLPTIFEPGLTLLSFLEGVYRGGLIGAATTGLVAWQKNKSIDVTVSSPVPVPPLS